MKKLMVIMLAVAMVLSLAATAFALNEEDYDNQDIFDIKEESKTLYPGVDYFFDCDWQGGDITDDFFEFYDASVSVSKDDEFNSISGKRKYNFTLKDTMEPQILKFDSPKDLYNMKIIIKSVYPGTKYKDTAISEISFR